MRNFLKSRAFRAVWKGIFSVFAEMMIPRWRWSKEKNWSIADKAGGEKRAEERLGWMLSKAGVLLGRGIACREGVWKGRENGEVFRYVYRNSIFKLPHSSLGNVKLNQT